MAMVEDQGSLAARPSARGVRTFLTLALLAGVVWGLCGATMAIAMSVTSLPNALLLHAAVAPVIAAGAAWVYFSRFGHTSPLVTASGVVGLVMAADFLVVALGINRSLDMFGSVVGTWLPFALIFASTFAAGVLCRKRSSARRAGRSPVARRAAGS
jgi:hypothetical protein